MIQSIKLAGKYLDQPLLLSKVKRAVTPGFIGGAGLFLANEVDKAPEDKKKHVAINKGSVLAATVISALAAPRIAAKIVGKTYEKYCAKDIIANNTKLVDTFLKENSVGDKTKSILEKAKTKVLSLKDIKNLKNDIYEKENGKKFFNTLIPEPDNITSKDIRNEIGRLSLLGFIPVAGGVAGGLAGEKMSDKKITREHLGNRIKEGSYQYLANIFLCNVGAGIALAGMEKANVKSKSVRALGMIGGIITTGIIGGSTIANYIGKKIINPIVDKKPKDQHKKEGLYSERTPEVLDICLHSDDIATIAVMSGLKWIEPTLPILYGISGYRAGMGYRNGKKKPQDTSKQQI